MTPQQINLVRGSFALMQPAARDAAALFFGHLFAADPSLRALFKGDLALQGEKLMGMFGGALGLLDKPAALTPVLRALGVRHRAYGVRAAHYDTVGNALLKTLEEGLGDDLFTADVRRAWITLYGMFTATMQESAREPMLAAA